MGNYKVQNITTVEKTIENPFKVTENSDPSLAPTITTKSNLTTFVIERPVKTNEESDEIVGGSGVIKPGDLKQIQLDDLFATILERLKIIEDKIDNLQKHLGPLGEIGNDITVITE